MEFAPVVALLALVYSVINFARMLRGKDYNGSFTQLAVWLAGFLVVLLVAQTDFASGIAVGDKTLASLNLASIIFVGLSIGSAGSVVNDTLGAIDSTRSTKRPNLTDGKES